MKLPTWARFAIDRSDAKVYGWIVLDIGRIVAAVGAVIEGSPESPYGTSTMAAIDETMPDFEHLMRREVAA